jgi:prepilin-type N-terminal cleavage/methylation domain-containing protein
MPDRNRQHGFSLVELSVVLLIMGLLLGGLAMPLAVQRENSRIKDGQLQLQSIQSAVEGFAMVNGFLPCPATPASDGYADASGGACSEQHGFVPATTLDLNGVRNADNLLLDPWGAPIRYSVSDADIDADGNWDFTSAGEMRSIGMPVLMPDLVVCKTASGSSASACGSANVTLSDRSPLVIYSLGRDWPSFSSADQLENVGGSLGGGASGASYPVAADSVFVTRGRSEQSGAEFDDLVVWLSSNGLYRVLVEAGQLP